MKLKFILLFIGSCIGFLNAQTNQNQSFLTKPKHALILVQPNMDAQVLIQKNIKINSKINQIWSVEFESSIMDSLLKCPGVLYVEQSNSLKALNLKNDIERQFSKVDKVHDGLNNDLKMNYFGKGVVVGIVDIGFQNNHPTFFDSEGKKTRISRYWHQGISGNPPSGFSYGTEYKDSSSIIATNDMDGSHGTHVAGIAAGSGFSTQNRKYKGMAPESELVFVTIKYSNDTLGGSALGDYVIANPTIIDAYQYIFNYATFVGKPAVINLSWGMHTGPHDGTSLFDLATEMLVGKGKVIVGANGNDGQSLMHIDYQFKNDTISTLVIENGRERRTTESVYCDFWGSKKSSFAMKIQVIDSNLQIVAETPYISSNINQSQQFILNASGQQFKIGFQCQKENIINQKPNITLTAENPNQSEFAFVLKIQSDSSWVHGWNSGASRAWTSGSFRNEWGKWQFKDSFLEGNSNYTAGENGGTSKAVISVGAAAARTAFVSINGKIINDSAYVKPGEIAPFSSRGPTVDGRIKPNIVAPGFDVPSSINNRQFAPWMLDRTIDTSVFRGQTQYWMASNGTSMAAPHVTGIVALLLEVYPELSAKDIQFILESTAEQDAQTGTVPNNSYGYGKVNAYEAVLMALQLLKVNSYLSPLELRIFPNPCTEVLNIRSRSDLSEAEISIFNALGQTQILETETLSLGFLKQLDVSGLNNGIYIIKIKYQDNCYYFKFLKN